MFADVQLISPASGGLLDVLHIGLSSAGCQSGWLSKGIGFAQGISDRRYSLVVVQRNIRLQTYSYILYCKASVYLWFRGWWMVDGGGGNADIDMDALL